MTTDTLISRIQLRRGNFEDLPILKDGELGYATDKKRLFIGNPSQIFTADDSPYYDLDFKIARPSQILVFIDNTQKTPGVHYTVVGTRLTFNEPMPAAGAVIEVGVNNEILIDKVETPTEILPMIGSSTNEFSGIFFDVTLYNTAFIDYSYKDAGNNMQAGRITLLSDGSSASITDMSNSIGHSNIEFSAEVVDGMVRVLYTTSSSDSGTLYYTIKAWYTW